MTIFLIAYYVLQWSWGILQNIAGLVLFLANADKKHYSYNGAAATDWHNKRGSVSLGMFIFISDTDPDREETKRHEYGHTLQSVILGPLYLIVIGLPSILWCALPCFVRYREKRGVSYYKFYTERWANKLAGLDRNRRAGGQ